MEKHRWSEHPGCPRCGDIEVYQMASGDGAREKHFRRSIVVPDVSGKTLIAAICENVDRRARTVIDEASQ